MNIGPEIINCLARRFELTHYFEKSELEELQHICDAEAFALFCRKTDREGLIGISVGSDICDQLRDAKKLSSLKKGGPWWLIELLTLGPLSLVINCVEKKILKSQIRKIEARMKRRQQLTTSSRTEPRIRGPVD